MCTCYTCNTGSCTSGEPRRSFHSPGRRSAWPGLGRLRQLRGHLRGHSHRRHHHSLPQTFRNKIFWTFRKFFFNDTTRFLFFVSLCRYYMTKIALLLIDFLEFSLSKLAKHITHSESPPRKKTIIINARAFSEPGGKYIKIDIKSLFNIRGSYKN